MKANYLLPNGKQKFLPYFAFKKLANKIMGPVNFTEYLKMFYCNNMQIYLLNFFKEKIIPNL